MALKTPNVFSSYIAAICIFFLAEIRSVNGLDTATVSITALTAFAIEPDCVQSCMFYNSFQVADYLLADLGCTSTIYNACYCTQIHDQKASTALSKCINALCKDTIGVPGAISLYESYCNGAGYPRTVPASQTSSATTSSQITQSPATSSQSSVPTPSPTPTNPLPVSTTSSSSSTSSSQQSTSGNTAPASSTSGNKKSNTGPIVGGVIGGLAFIAIVGGIFFFFLRSRRSKSGQTPHQNPAPIPTQAPNYQQEKQSVTATSKEMHTTPLVSPISDKEVPALGPRQFAGGRAELGGGGRYGLRPEELDSEGNYVGELHGDGRQPGGAELP